MDFSRSILREVSANLFKLIDTEREDRMEALLPWACVSLAALSPALAAGVVFFLKNWKEIFSPPPLPGTTKCPACGGKNITPAGECLACGDVSLWQAR